MTNSQIHPTAIIAEGAELVDGVDVGPYAVIEDRVHVGAGTVIGPHAAIHDHARIRARYRALKEAFRALRGGGKPDFGESTPELEQLEAWLNAESKRGLAGFVRS